MIVYGVYRGLMVNGVLTGIRGNERYMWVDGVCGVYRV